MSRMEDVTCRNCDLTFGIDARSQKAFELISDSNGATCPYCGITNAVLGDA